MERRRLLAVGAALAAAPLALRAASAQTAETARTAMNERQPDDLAAAKVPVVAAGTYSKRASLMALQRATVAPLRTFAQLEVAEQEAVGQAFAVSDGMAMLTEAQVAKLEALEAADGASFDRMYLDAQVEGHETLRVLVETYLAEGDDPLALGAATVGVPAIDSHLEMLRMIGEAMA